VVVVVAWRVVSGYTVISNHRSIPPPQLRAERGRPVEHAVTEMGPVQGPCRDPFGGLCSTQLFDGSLLPLKTCINEPHQRGERICTETGPYLNIPNGETSMSLSMKNDSVVEYRGLLAQTEPPRFVSRLSFSPLAPPWATPRSRGR